MEDSHVEFRESERRQATVMFADICGFTEMSEHMDPEEVTSTLNDCFQLMGAVVDRYGGTIDKFIGDCVMVLFGVPEAMEDAPQKAVNSAIEIRNRIAAFNKKNNFRVALDVHIGINTGPVIAGAVGSPEKREYTVIGDAVNVASRLKDLSGRGEVYVGPLTYRYTKSDFDYVDFTASLKGRMQSVSAYKLLSTKEKIHRPQPGFSRRVHSAMVGRDKELRTLADLLRESERGRGAIVSVVADAGIGKSRLIAELRRSEAASAAVFLEGRALSTGKNLSFHPIVDILKEWAGIGEDDTELESMGKLEIAVRQVHPQGIREVFPFIATLMGMKLTGEHADRLKGIEGEALEKLILVSLSELLTHAASRRHYVIVVEDLHWADLSSIELLEALYRLAEDNGILFVNVFRPNYPETGERVLRTIGERYGHLHTRIDLDPLDDGQCHEMIQNLLNIEGLPLRIKDLIAERAEGNPFFIEEVIRSFIDDGVVRRRDEHFEITEKINAVVIPVTIRDLLMSRIDKLDEDTKTIVKLASVIGRDFFYKILAEVARPLKEIARKLDHLKEVQLIVERSRMAEVEYHFKHALVQEATYDSILLRKRRELHLLIANAIETVFAERLREFYGMLAFHYGHGKDLEKTEEYLIKAGEEAVRTSASIEALNYYQEALALYLEKHGDSGNPEKIASLEKNIALALFSRGHYVDAIEHFDRVLENWGVRKRKGRAAAAFRFFAEFLNVVAELYLPSVGVKKIPGKRDNEYVNLTEKKGLALAQVDTRRMFLDTIGTLKRLNGFDLSKVENGAAIYMGGSGLFSFSGVSFAISRKIQEYTRKYVREDDIKSVFFHEFYGLVLDFLSGEWKEGFEYDDNLVSRYLKTGDVYQAAAHTVISALLLIEQGRFNEAVILIDRIQNIGEIYNNDYARGTKYLVNTKLLLKRRELNNALREAEEGIVFLNRVHQPLYALCVTGTKANVQVILNDTVGAQASLAQVEKHRLEVKAIAPFYISNLLVSRFLCDLSLLEESTGRWPRDKMRINYEKALRSGRAAVRNSRKYAPNATETLRLMGVFFWLAGKTHRSLRWFERSIETGSKLGAKLELARSYVEAGRRLATGGRRSGRVCGMGAEELLDKGEALLEEMGLNRELEGLVEFKSRLRSISQ